MKYIYNDINSISKRRYHKNTKSKIYTNIILTIFLLLLIVFSLWLIFEEVDVVINTNGVIRYSDNTSTIYNIRGGFLSYIADDKEIISKGDLVFEIDDKELKIKKELLIKKNHKLKDKVDDLKLLISYLNNQEIKTDIINPIYRAEKDLIFRKIQQYKEKIDHKKKRLKTLKQFEGVSISKNELNIIKRELKDIKYQLELYKNSQLVSLKREVIKYSEQINNNNRQLEQIVQRIKENKIRAPISGNIQLIKRYNLKDYIPAGDIIMKIIPETNDKYIVDLIVKNKDVLKIKKDDKIRYKIASYPYKEHGIANGKVLNIDSEVTNLKEQSYIYKITANIEPKLIKGGKRKKIQYKSGMLVNASIIVDQRKIIYYFLEKLDFI
ncbi:MAG: HlyD family efflux transporter periplasmic adaptor subunit [Halanaerobiales bacterium]|nr:HlyD family efflux transporter periplasmic adaptor subunit [Halanaerobiales bacterium]